MFPGCKTSFACFPCIFFFLFFSLKEKHSAKKKKKTCHFLCCNLQDILQDCCTLTTKLPFLLCHAVEKLLASKFSLSRTSALLVLLPLGSFQYGHVIPQLEAPIYFLMHFSAVQHSHSQRKHHCMNLYLRRLNVKKGPRTGSAIYNWSSKATTNSAMGSTMFGFQLPASPNLPNIQRQIE